MNLFWEERARLNKRSLPERVDLTNHSKSIEVCSDHQKTVRSIGLSSTCKQVVLGGLLGDGSTRIQTRYKNARYQIRHSATQFAYILWKHTKLSEIALPKLQIQKGSVYSTNALVNLQGRACKDLTKIHSVVRENNVLCVRRSWLDTLDGLALLIWWLDDGSLVANGRRGCFCTNGFSFETQNTLQQYLLERWEIKTTIGKVKAEKKNTIYYRLYLNNTNLKKVFASIVPLLEVKEMLSKFAIRYKRECDQKRWISTMKIAMSRFQLEIDDLYNNPC